jgi:hypothetical protein
LRTDAGFRPSFMYSSKSRLEALEGSTRTFSAHRSADEGLFAESYQKDAREQRAVWLSSRRWHFSASASKRSPTRFRLNRIINRDFRVDSSVATGAQVIDAVLELFMAGEVDGESFHEAASIGKSGGIDVIGAYEVSEHVVLPM